MKLLFRFLRFFFTGHPYRLTKTEDRIRLNRILEKHWQAGRHVYPDGTVIDLRHMKKATIEKLLAYFRIDTLPLQKELDKRAHLIQQRDTNRP